MSRKDYEFIAALLKSERPNQKAWETNPSAAGAVVLTLDNLAHEMANHFERCNARFDRARFMQACGFIAH